MLAPSSTSLPSNSGPSYPGPPFLLAFLSAPLASKSAGHSTFIVALLLCASMKYFATCPACWSVSFTKKGGKLVGLISLLWMHGCLIGGRYVPSLPPCAKGPSSHSILVRLERRFSISLYAWYACVPLFFGVAFLSGVAVGAALLDVGVAGASSVYCCQSAGTTRWYIHDL